MNTAPVSITSMKEKWHSSPVTRYSGPIHAVRAYIPAFERRPFSLNQAPAISRREPGLFEGPEVLVGVNPRYDVIVRIPFGHERSGTPEVPVGIVSPQYTLLQHQKVVDEVLKAVGELGVDPARIEAHVDLTRFGERMRLSLVFPEEFALPVAEKDLMALRLECFNSVDGTTRFMAVIGWLRFVCSNGLVLGQIETDYRRRHNHAMDIQEIIDVLRDGIAATAQEEKIFQKWMRKTFARESLTSWIDGVLAKQWGVKAAVRTWHITQHGKDVTLADPFEPGKPTEKSVIQGPAVPGAILPGDNVFAVAQALAWLAKERMDVQEQLAWKQQIPSLVQPLLT